MKKTYRKIAEKLTSEGTELRQPVAELEAPATDYKQAEQALVDEATRRRILIDQSLDGIVVLNENAKVYEANQKFAEMLGYTPEEVRELHTWDWDKNFPPEKLLEMGRNVDEKGLHLETKHHRKDGSVIDVDISINGAVIAGQKLIFCVCRDITERKKAEQALRDSEEKTRKMFDSVSDGISVVDLNSVITEVNQRTVEMHGLGSKDELVGKNAFDIVAPHDREKIARNMGRAIKEGTISGIEYTLLKSDGSEFPAELSTSALKNAYGKVIGHITIARDITERKQAEQALQAEKNKLQSLIDALEDDLSIQDKHHNIIYQNKPSKTNFGDHGGEKCYQAFERRDKICPGCPVEKAFKDGKSHTSERKVLTLSGEAIYLENTANPVRDASGEMVACVEIGRNITERKRAEEALQTERNKLQSVIGAIEYDLTIQDKDYNIIYQNESSRINSGGNHIGEKCYRAYGGRDKVCPGCPVKKAFKDGKSHTSERKPLSPSGEVTFWENTANPIRDASGEIVSCLEIGRNITERKKAEQALQAEKNKLQSLIDALEDDLSIQDKHYNIIYQNERSRISSGGDRTGEKCYRAYEDKDKVDEDCPVKKAFKDGKSHTSERKWVKPSGEVIFWEATANPVRDAEGNIVSCLEVARNITERKKTEQALKESEEFSTSLLTNSPNPMLVINQDTSVRYVNPALEKLTGFSPQEVIGRKAPYPWWTEETLKKTAKDLGQAMRQGARRLEELFQKKNGELFWVEITSTPVTSDGEFKYYLANWVDITERKQAAEREKEMQQELLLSSRLASIGELAAGVAHQINNPLTGVLGFSQRLLRKIPDQETKQDLERIYTEAERAAKVVQNLLTFARRRQPHKQYSDINEILESALELRDYELRTSNIEVITNLTPELPEIMLDFYHIQEVFLNIILNAEQALTEAHNGGKLTIQTEKRKEYIRTTFTDDGPGIPAERLDNIFDPFYTTKGEKGGTGLGLSVCHGIITEHGGKIYAKSKPGKGTTFFVELPLTPN